VGALFLISNLENKAVWLIWVKEKTRNINKEVIVKWQVHSME